jgi:sensor histidine kinase regulating citrate/malate metabolism
MKCYIAFQRGEKYDGFTSHQVNVLKALAPHIHKAILINEKTTQLEIKNNTLSNSLDQINSAILLVDNNGKILFINYLAEKLIKKQSGIFIKSTNEFIG